MWCSDDMAWTHGNWRSAATPADRLRLLNLHLEEVESKITATVSSGANSRDASTLEAMVTRLDQERRRLERTVGADGGAAVATVRLG